MLQEPKEFTPTEEVKVAHKSDLILASEQIGTGIAAFDNKKAELEALAEDSKGLKITDINDKSGAKLVYEKRIALKNTRVEITKQAKSMRDSLTKVSKDISAREKELIDIIEPTEKELQAEEDRIEAEKEKIKQAAIDAENKRVQDRADKLFEYGFKLEISDLKAMSDETFDVALNGAKSAYEKEQAEKAEAERIAAEAEAKRLKDLQDEQDKIAAERKELEELREKQAEIDRKQKEAQDKIDAENKKLADEKAAMEAKKQSEIDEANRKEELRLATEKAVEAERLKAIEDQRLAELKRLEDERIAKELEAEKAANAPDKKKIESYIAQLMSVPVPELKTAKSKKIMADIQVLMNKVNEFSKEKVTTL